METGYKQSSRIDTKSYFIFKIMNKYDKQNQKHGFWEIEFQKYIYQSTYCHGQLQGIQKMWLDNSDEWWNIDECSQERILAQQENYRISKFNRLHGLCIKSIWGK